MRHKLRVGLLIGTLDVPAWQHAMLVEIANSDYAFIVARIQTTAESLHEMSDERACSLQDAFQRYEREKKPIAGDACEVLNAGELLGDVECITLPADPENNNRRDGNSKTKIIQAHELDVILAMGNITSIDMLVELSKYGVWFFDFNYNDSIPADSSRVGLREVIKRQPFLRSALIVRSANFDGDKTAYKTFSSVDPMSHIVTKSEHLWKVRAFVPRTLRRLHAYGGKRFLHELRIATTVSRGNVSRAAPKLGNSSILVPLAWYALWRLKLKIARRFVTEKWILMFSLGGNSCRLKKYQKIHPPKDWFWADPFVVLKEDQFYIFFEEASVDTGHGHIAVIRMDNAGNYSQPERILERPYHLSYPFIFEWQQNTYMIPESAKNRTIEVYKCKEFPYVWEFECNLMENLSAYDATLFEYNNMWWLFVTVREHQGASTWDELCLFYSSNPLSKDWCPHPLNPIVSDVRSARPAGRIFEKNGRIYRPSQNSSYRYGYGLNFCEILELTETAYAERLVESFEPNWDRSVRATHTFSSAGDLSVIDAIYRTRRRGR